MIQNILNKYQISPGNFYPDIPEGENVYTSAYDPEFTKECELRESELLAKWKHRIPQGWYGFAFGAPTPLVWFDVIDEFLDYLAEQAPQFEIHQIKMKFGGLRFYVALNIGLKPWWLPKWLAWIHRGFYHLRRKHYKAIYDSLDKQIEELEGALYDSKLAY